jgi:hypothetical protein
LFCLNAVQFRQRPVQDNFFTADKEDRFLDPLNRDWQLLRSHAQIHLYSVSPDVVANCDHLSTGFEITICDLKVLILQQVLFPQANEA